MELILIYFLVSSVLNDLDELPLCLQHQIVDCVCQRWEIDIVSTEVVPGGKKNDIWVPWVTQSLDVEMFVKRLACHDLQSAVQLKLYALLYLINIECIIIQIFGFGVPYEDWL